MRLYNIKREFLFAILTKFDLNLAHASALFCSAWLTDSQAKEINFVFPETVFLQNL